MSMLVVRFCCGIFTGDYKTKCLTKLHIRHFFTNLDHHNVLERMKGEFKH